MFARRKSTHAWRTTAQFLLHLNNSNPNRNVGKNSQVTAFGLNPSRAAPRPSLNKFPRDRLRFKPLTASPKSLFEYRERRAGPEMGLEEEFKGNLETIWMVADMFPEGFGTGV